MGGRPAARGGGALAFLILLRAPAGGLRLFRMLRNPRTNTPGCAAARTCAWRARSTHGLRVRVLAHMRSGTHARARPLRTPFPGWGASGRAGGEGATAGIRGGPQPRAGAPAAPLDRAPLLGELPLLRWRAQGWGGDRGGYGGRIGARRWGVGERRRSWRRRASGPRSRGDLQLCDACVHTRAHTPHTHTHTHPRTPHAHTRARARTHTHMHTHTHAHTNTHKHTHTNTHAHTREEQAALEGRGPVHLASALEAEQERAGGPHRAPVGGGRAARGG